MHPDNVELTARTPSWIVRECGVIATCLTNAEDRLSLGLDVDLSYVTARMGRLVARLEQEQAEDAGRI